MMDAEERAIESRGASMPPVYRMVRLALEERGLSSGTLVDVGCGNAALFRELEGHAFRYVGVDLLRYPDFPPHLELVLSNLDANTIPISDGAADVAVSAETIEHVENPRALMRELVRIVRPGGWVIVTTPNQLSLASLLCLVARQEFQHFQKSPGLYPAHITALLEIDLRRIAGECGLVDVDITYSGRGRIPFSERHWPQPLVARRGVRARVFSDNVLVCGRKNPAT
jgi:SAM-dependent methyltransferase